VGGWPIDPLFIGGIDLGGEESRFAWLAVPIMVIISTAFLKGTPSAKGSTPVTTEKGIAFAQPTCGLTLG
jgi:hypothetical protein